MLDRKYLPRIAAGMIVATGAIMLVAGCTHHVAPATSTAAAPTATAAPAQNAPFQPYVLVNNAAPYKQATTHTHRYLHIVHESGRIYLSDPDGRNYAAGRDQSGRIYPVYNDPATNQYYPLYYDNGTDRYYRVLHTDGGGYYRGYVGAPDSQYYATSDTYDSNTPPPEDCPIVTDSSYNGPYNDNGYGNSDGYTNGYYDNGGYGNYAPQIYDHHDQSDTLLWSIPIIVGAYLLLSRHYDNSPQPVYYVQRDGNRPTIIQRTDITNFVNAPVTIYNGGRRTTYYATVTPPPGHSSIYYGAPPNRQYSHDPRIASNLVRVWRPSNFTVTRVPANARTVPITQLHLASNQSSAVPRMQPNMPHPIANLPIARPRSASFPQANAPSNVRPPLGTGQRSFARGQVHTANQTVANRTIQPPARPSVAAKLPTGIRRTPADHTASVRVISHPAKPATPRPGSVARTRLGSPPVSIANRSAPRPVVPRARPISRSIARPNHAAMRPTSRPTARPTIHVRPTPARPAPAASKRIGSPPASISHRSAPRPVVTKARPVNRSIARPNPAAMRPPSRTAVRPTIHVRFAPAQRTARVISRPAVVARAATRPQARPRPAQSPSRSRNMTAPAPQRTQSPRPQPVSRSRPPAPAAPRFAPPAAHPVTVRAQTASHPAAKPAERKPAPPAKPQPPKSARKSLNAANSNQTNH